MSKIVKNREGSKVKLGLCIKYFNHNYGSQLQSFATVNYLEMQGYNLEVIKYIKKKDLQYFCTMSLKYVFNAVFRNDVNELLKKKIFYIRNKTFKENDSIRHKKFDDFIEEQFDNVKVVNGYKQLKECSNSYDVVITGSDQLWSPGGLSSNFFNLQFCESNVRRVSWASSFGVSEIPGYQLEKTKDYLSKMDFISVREESGAKIIHDLINRDVPVVCDPVMMLTKSKWEELIPYKNIIKEKYIFAYFLGDNPEHRKAVKEFSIKTGLKIVTIPHLDQYIESDVVFGDYQLYDVGPKEFLNLIRGAKFIFTDSFHGVVFSIINHKQFLVFNRYSNTSKVSKNSRIDTILNLVKVDRRYDGNIDKVEDLIDFDAIDNVVDQLRENASNYLMEALKL